MGSDAASYGIERPLDPYMPPPENMSPSGRFLPTHRSIVGLCRHIDRGGPYRRAEPDLAALVRLRAARDPRRACVRRPAISYESCSSVQLSPPRSCRLIGVWVLPGTSS